MMWPSRIEDPNRMSFLQHLEELRARLLRIVVVLVAAFFLAWNTIEDWIRRNEPIMAWHRRQYLPGVTNSWALFAIGNRKSKSQLSLLPCSTDRTEVS